MLYQMAAGILPFKGKGDTAALLYQIMHGAADLRATKCWPCRNETSPRKRLPSGRGICPSDIIWTPIKTGCQRKAEKHEKEKFLRVPLCTPWFRF
jgi:hypothetical protein